MRVVIMNDYLIFGGAEMQGRREKKLLESKGHEAYLVTFDQNFKNDSNEFSEENGFINIPIPNSKVDKVKGHFMFHKDLYDNIREVLIKLKPDIIHVNNFYLAPLTQYKALEGFKAVQTIRDYTAVCPKSTCIYKDNTVCKGANQNNCFLECTSLKIVPKIIMFNNVYELKKKYINKFICPSEKLTEYCKDMGFDVVCINNPFDFSKLEGFNKRVDYNKKKYMYYGVIDDNKGVYQLIDAFNEFSKDKDVELIIAGKADEEHTKKLQSYLGNEKIKYLGFLSYDDCLKQLEEVYCVVVPSLWMENYPNTVLESLSTGTLVLGSDRGGIPDMLKDNKGIIFDVLNKESIINALNKSYNMDKTEYEEITERAKKFSISNNTIERYYENIMGLFEEVINR